MYYLFFYLQQTSYYRSFKKTLNHSLFQKNYIFQMPIFGRRIFQSMFDCHKFQPMKQMRAAWIVNAKQMRLKWRFKESSSIISHHLQRRKRSQPTHTHTRHTSVDMGWRWMVEKRSCAQAAQSMTKTPSDDSNGSLRLQRSMLLKTSRALHDTINADYISSL